MILNFKIQYIDHLGRGVYEQDDTQFLFPYTLVGETGTFEYKQVNTKRKQIIIPPLNRTISKKSPERTAPGCPHFTECSGCQYLHTSYENEFSLKKNQFISFFSPFIQAQSMDFFPAPKRFSYRKRVQLHYNLINKEIGFINTFNKQITSVPNCSLPTKSIQEEFKKLYNQEFILDFNDKSNLEKGHFEIQDHGDKVKTSYNKKYGADSFSQANPYMNEILKKEIFNFVINRIQKLNNLSILDLFGGSGNLTQKFTESKTFVLDIKMNKNQLLKHQKGHILNLYNPKSIKDINKIINRNISLLIVNPPRKGFFQLPLWINQIRPDYFIYVSCNAETATRDISPIKDMYKLEKAKLFDFFPSTRHFESALFFQRNK